MGRQDVGFTTVQGTRRRGRTMEDRVTRRVSVVMDTPAGVSDTDLAGSVSEGLTGRIRPGWWIGVPEVGGDKAEYNAPEIRPFSGEPTLPLAGVAREPVSLARVEEAVSAATLVTRRVFPFGSPERGPVIAALVPWLLDHGWTDAEK
jgi:hypothetical protein